MWFSGRKFRVVGFVAPEVRTTVPVSATPANAAVTLTRSSFSALPRLTSRVGCAAQSTLANNKLESVLIFVGRLCWVKKSATSAGNLSKALI